MPPEIEPDKPRLPMFVRLPELSNRVVLLVWMTPPVVLMLPEPLKDVPPDIEPVSTILPEASTLNLLVGDAPACRSIRLPDGAALVLETRMKALPLPALPEPVIFRLLPVLVPLVKLNTPPVPALPLLVKLYKLPLPALALELSVAFFAK